MVDFIFTTLMEFNSSFSLPFLHPHDHLSYIINHDKPKVSREISYPSTQITQLSQRLIHWVIYEPKQGNPSIPQIPIGIVWKWVGCVLGIEPNEHQIPRFQGKYSNHTDHSENPERPNSPNVLPMSQWLWDVGFFVWVNLSVFWELGRRVGLSWVSSELLWIRMVR